MKKIYSLKLAVITAIIIVLGINGCKKEESAPVPTPATTNPPVPTSNLYFQATINGTAVAFQDGVGGYGAGGGSEGGTEPSGWQEGQTSMVTKAFSAQNLGGIQIMKGFVYQPTNTQIDSMFAVKSYAYGKQSPSSNIDGVDGARVFYYDNSGVEWTTDLGTADQTGSAFSITEHIVNEVGVSHRISKITFNCTLYNSTGGSMILTNGVYRGRTVYY
ncbi:MAG: hypothetical protein V4511_15470 [Bacteroidota bacterium]